MDLIDTPKEEVTHEKLSKILHAFLYYTLKELHSPSAKYTWHKFNKEMKWKNLTKHMWVKKGTLHWEKLEVYKDDQHPHAEPATLYFKVQANKSCEVLIEMVNWWHYKKIIFPSLYIID